MKPFNLLFSTAILAFLTVLVLYSFQYPFEGRLFPLVVGIPAVMGLLLVILKEFFSLRKAAPEEAPSGPKAAPEEAPSGQEDGNPLAYALIVAWMAGFLAMIYVLGFYVSIPLFLFLYLLAHGLGWFRSARLAAGIIVAIYCIFALLMQMDLYPGLIYLTYLK